MSESDISALKSTLYAQQHLLQKLYHELEAEREASATAANEALSVILRLEGEKAAVKMEAEQYKRLSEQKICHAEESLAIIEDVIYQKEMEVAALDHQVQAYRCKLLSMGYSDPGFGELKLHDKDDRLERSENYTGETSVQSIGRRNSAPVSCKYKNTVFDQASDSDKKSYWDQIRTLDVQVKEVAGPNCMKSRSESPSSVSSRISSDKAKKSSESRNGVAVDSSCSMSIHDVFEVPEVDEGLNSRESIEREDVVCPGEGKMDGGDETDWLKKVLKSSENKVGQTSSGVNCSLVVVHPRTNMSEFRVDRTSEVVEEVDERLAESSHREEEMKLLNEIKEKLDSLHDEIMSLKVKKSSTRDEPSLSILSEAMLYFWL